MAEDEISEDIDENIDIFLETLNSDELNSMLTSSIVIQNFETLNEIIEPLKDAENELQNPSLKINKEIRRKIQVSHAL